MIEWESVDLARRKNNPLGYFGRLKADQPERYVERAQIASVTNILNMGAPEMDRDRARSWPSSCGTRRQPPEPLSPLAILSTSHPYRRSRPPAA